MQSYGYNSRYLCRRTMHTMSELVLGNIYLYGYNEETIKREILKHEVSTYAKEMCRKCTPMFNL